MNINKFSNQFQNQSIRISRVSINQTHQHPTSNCINQTKLFIVQCHQQHKRWNTKQKNTKINLINSSPSKFKVAKASLSQILNKIYLKRVRYPVQLFKQFILFNSSDQSIDIGYKYINQTISQGIELLQNTLILQLQKRKIMAFTKIKLLAMQKKNNKRETELQTKKNEKVLLLGFLNTFSKIMNKIYINKLSNCFDQIKQKRRQKKMIRKNIIQNPISQLNSKQNTVISESINKTSRKTKQTNIENQYQSIEKYKSQSIYLINTNKPFIQNVVTKYIKIPIESNTIQINEINILNNKIQKSRSNSKRRQQKHYKLNKNSNEIVKCHNNEQNSCKYCKVFMKFDQKQNSKKIIKKVQISNYINSTVRSKRLYI